MHSRVRMPHPGADLDGKDAVVDVENGRITEEEMRTNVEYLLLSWETGTVRADFPIFLRAPGDGGRHVAFSPNFVASSGRISMPRASARR